MTETTDEKYERLLAMVERLMQPPTVNITIDFGSLLKALEKRKKKDDGDDFVAPVPYVS